MGELPPEQQEGHPCWSWPHSLEIISLRHCPGGIVGRAQSASSSLTTQNDRCSALTRVRTPGRHFLFTLGLNLLTSKMAATALALGASASKANTEHLPQMIQNSDFLTLLLFFKKKKKKKTILGVLGVGA